MAITLEELQAATAKFGGVLSRGPHAGKDGACVWEAYNFARGKDWSDRCPDCVSPDLHSFLIRLNDSHRWKDDAERTEVLLPAVIRALGTRGDEDARRARSMRMADVAMRVIAPAALDAAKQPELARRLRDLTPITDKATAIAARDEGRAVRDVARAYADAADAAADAADAAAADAYAAAARAADAADAARHTAWRRHIDALLVAAGLADETH